MAAAPPHGSFVLARLLSVDSTEVSRHRL